MTSGQDLLRRPCADEEDPAIRHRAIPDDAAPPTSEEKTRPARSKRVASLDIFRGLTVALMILVDGAGGEWPVIGHAPWNGCNLADFVMPFFLFIVGMAIPLSLKRIPSRARALRRVMVRTLKLLFWGIILQGGYSHAPDKLTYGVDMKQIRWCGILQRIALAYMVVAVLEILTKDTKFENQSTTSCSLFKLYCWQWRSLQWTDMQIELFAACVLAIYFAVIYGTYVPDWEFTVHDSDSQDYGKGFKVICGTRGSLGPPCNAVGYVDRQVLGINHMYRRPAWKRSKACTYGSPHAEPLRNDAPAWCQSPFEPEGIVRLGLLEWACSISAILSTIIGVHFGHVLVHMKSHLNRLIQWISIGISLLVFGIILHFTHAIPLNKQLYSLSYVCVTAGAAAIVFSIFYFLVDIVGLRNLFRPLEWIGMNAMLVFVMAAEGIFEGFLNGWYYESTNNTLVYWIQKHIFIKVWHSRRVGILLYVVFAQILFWGLVAGVLHRLGIYWKL
ncbi:heparan-alpha-glucosaminide N-acetyltransferase-like [Musa troglodytarum]|uniref:Heparan-alpha-glucosaminide N-acetyltransferase-like n=1 Tax=Musa troglodytarum TaxID=320322 RepID=A0A9E7JTD4_9LILI|nr:heparan-alpha-glucosaminide N-acetyltransferase-like [Musa troglodytarum]